VYFLQKIEKYFIVFLMLSMPSIYCINVLANFVSEDSSKYLFWVGEFTQFQLVILVTFGLGYVQSKQSHITMDIFKNMYGKRIRKASGIIVSVFGLVFSGYLTWLGLVYSGKVMSSGQISNTLGVPMYFLYISLPVGGVLLGIRHIHNLFSALQPRPQ